ncbi:MAG: hypothetical protein ACJ78Q_18220 [Chloroflexia bacterium]
MPKKTARATNRSAQQKSKEEQWRKRMAAQTRTTTGMAPNGAAGTASAVTDRDGIDDVDSVTGAMVPNGSQAQVPASTARTTSTAGRRTAAAASAATMQRRATMAAAARTSARGRLAANTLSIDDEMRYIKGDIRRLIILTVVCVAVIIALSFIVPSIIT